MIRSIKSITKEQYCLPCTRGAMLASSIKHGELEMTKTSIIHVVPRTAQWVVRTEGSARPTSVFSTKREAIQTARKIALSRNGELVIHNKDGRISERNTYGAMPPQQPRVVLFPATKSKRTGAIRHAVRAAIRKAPGTAARPIPKE